MKKMMIDDDDGEDNKFSVIIKISLIFLMMVNTSLKRFWMVVKNSLKKFSMMVKISF